MTVAPPCANAPTLRWALCVPTLNAGARWSTWLARTLPALAGNPLLVIDSSSDDSTARHARNAGAEVVEIPRSSFDHGGTRDWAVRHLTDTEVVVFLTQDALVEDANSLNQLVGLFCEPNVGAAFGRQLPHENATAIAAHARLFNYPAASRRVSLADTSRLGIKAAFLSNSFAAYRRDALLNVGSFPHGTILSEDMIAGARLLNAGWELAYCAEARVYHSHNYSLLEEFKRYFDIGVLHQREAWLLAQFGKPEGEGVRFVLSEWRYLCRHAPLRLPEAALRTLLKYTGYRLGRLEKHLPQGAKQRLSMHTRYWQP